MAVTMTFCEQRERIRLAHVLHDELPQFLAAARINVALLRRGGNDEQLARTIGQLDDLLRVPDPGLLMVPIGIALSDFPGKHRGVTRLFGSARGSSCINRLWHRSAQPSFVPDQPLGMATSTPRRKGAI
jgi:hypothetical protein